MGMPGVYVNCPLHGVWRSLKEGEAIRLDDQFEIRPGVWEAVGDESPGLRWTDGVAYDPTFFLPARRRHET